MYSLVIKNAKVVDGTGKPAFGADVAVEGGRIVNVAPQVSEGGKTVIDAAGKVLAPGFIDVQNHSDSYGQLFENPGLDASLLQGFTTVCVGACGASLAPLLSPVALESMRKWHSTGGENVSWRTFSEFSSAMAERRFGPNVASFVGYGTVRRGIAGDSSGPLGDQNLKSAMKAVADAVAAGAFGVSFGLSYSHERGASRDELAAVARAAAAAGGNLAVHLRDEGDRLNEAVLEALELAEQAGGSLRIAHLKARGAAGSRHLADALKAIETAAHRLRRVCFDVYPYDAVWEPLHGYLPPWAAGGGRAEMLRHLKDGLQRRKLLDWLKSSGVRFSDLTVSSEGTAKGKRLSRLAADFGTTAEEAFLTLLEHGGDGAAAIEQCLDERDVWELCRHPLSVIGSDGAGFPAGKSGDRLIHPRAFGTAPRLLRFGRERGDLSIEEAVAKLTNRPAAAIGLKDRGTVSIGSYADLVIFDPASVVDQADYEDPYRAPLGISHVYVGGQLAAVSGERTRQLSGTFLVRR